MAMNLSLSGRRVIGSLGYLLAVGLPLALAAPQDQSKAKEEPKKPPLYDTKADAQAQVDVATAAAKRDHSRVLVMFGFEGCGWCHRLHALFAQNPEIRKLLHDEYVRVQVDIQAPHAAELLKTCKAALSEEELKKGIGYPFLAVLDGAGKVVTAQRTDPLEEGDHHDPAKVKEFLAKWVAPPTDARPVLDAALAQAAADDKRVFLHFGAPWCGWCHKLDDFLARPEIAAIVNRDYVDVKIDIDRMGNGKGVLAEYRKGDAGGIPWFVILDGKGKVLVTSDGPKGNIGYPAEVHEIEHFLVMLKQTARRIEPAQFEQIETTLRKARADLGLDRGR
jgi:thioredoxin-related protein